ncbi:MAG: Bug family tripartite tricarboxylate transporter substrate binding protein [Pseudolabrys sp.]
MVRLVLKLASALVVLAVAFVGAAPSVMAQDWPDKPVTVVVPFAAGGNTDGIARMTAQHLSDAFGKQFVVENRPGAGGAIAADIVAKAKPDGYTLFLTALPVMAIVPVINKVRYDSLKDFTPISNVATNAFVLVVNKDLPIKTLAEFVNYVKARQGQLSYGSAGIGSLNHLSMALFLKRAGLEMTHVPYKGNAPALSDVVAGHIPAMFSNLSDALPQAKGGTVRMLAVSSKDRSPQAADVPTVAESGYAGFNVLTWNGLMGPANLPQAIVEKIAGEMGKAVKQPDFSQRLDKFGVEPLGNTPAQYKAMLAEDIENWAKALKLAGISQQ